MGMARVLEAQGEDQKALAVYEEYLGSFLGEEQNEPLTRMIQKRLHGFAFRNENNFHGC